MAKHKSEDKPKLTRRQHISKAQRESNMQRAVLIITGIVTVIVVGLLIYALVNEFYIRPNQIVATVDGVEIKGTDFQERAAFDYYGQTGWQSLDVVSMQWGMPADPVFWANLTMQGMTESVILKAKAEEMGITVSEEEIESRSRRYISQIQGFSLPEGEAEEEAAPTATQVTTPTATPTLVHTYTPRPTQALEEGLTPTLTPTTTPAGALTPTPTFTPSPTSPSMTDEDYDAGFDEYLTVISTATGIPKDHVRDTWHEVMYMAVLREKMVEALDFEVDEITTRVHAAQIQVESEEDIFIALERITAGESFEVVAAEMSLDATAPAGGDLGWLSPNPEQMSAIEEIALALEVGEMSGPFETDFGWHLVKVYDRDDNVPISESAQEQQRQELFQEQIAKWREESEIVQDPAWADFFPNYPRGGVPEQPGFPPQP